MKHHPLIFLIFLLVLIVEITPSVFAQQQPTPVTCGMIVEAEFALDEELDRYSIEMAALDQVVIRVKHALNGTYVSLRLYDPAGNRIAGSSLSSGLINRQVAAGGVYIINAGEQNGIGLYTLSISCTLNTGEVIEPGDVVTPIPPAPPTAIPTVSSVDLAFVGFPGIPAVDFSQAAFPKLPVSTPFEGEIAPTGNSILGFKFDANANDTLELNLNRPSGNLIVGIIILSPINKMVFQTSLVTSTTLNTRFILPDTGIYTIGVFRIEPLPDDPQVTAFQVQTALNP